MTGNAWAGDRATAELAAEMIAVYGLEAGREAARRAERCRDAGNSVNFCNWRQAERLIVLLATGRAQGTVH